MNIEHWIIFALFFVLWSLSLYFVQVSGRRLGIPCQSDRQKDLNMLEHRHYVDIFICIAAWSVLGLEFFIQFVYKGSSGLHVFSTNLGIIHIVLDVGFVLALSCMRFVWTGLNYPYVHAFLFKVILILHVLVFVTGGILMENLLLR